MVDIKSTSNITRFSTPINEGSKRKYTLMKEDYITLKFSVENPVYFKLGDYVDESFGLFELVDLCKPTVNEVTGGYDYELRLDAYYWKWKNKKFFYSPEVGGSEAGWNLTATLKTHMEVFLRNLESLGYAHKDGAFSCEVDSTVELSSKLVQYDNTNLIDALTRIAETWECEWWIIGSVIHFGRCEFGEPIDFDLEANVSSMSRSDSKTSFATRVYAFGSTRNIPSTYRKNLIFDVKEVSGRNISDTSRKLDIKFFPESAKIEAPKIQVTFNHDPGQGYFTTNPATYTKDWSIANSLNAGTYKLNPKKLTVSGIKGGAGNLLGAYKATLSILYVVNGEEKSIFLQSKEGESNGTNKYKAEFTECSFTIEKDASNCRLSINTSITFFGSDANVAFWIMCDAAVQCIYYAANIPVTFLSGANKGLSFNSIYNPDFLTGDASNIIRLPEGVTASKGDTYTIDNIIRSKVPSNYFSKSTTEPTVEGVVTNRLMLPLGTSCVNAYEDMTQEEAIEDIVIFEDIYPRILGAMENVVPHPYKTKIEEDGKETVVEEWDAYRFKDSKLIFSKDYVLPGQELQITFQSGSLNGMNFAVAFNPYDKEGGDTFQPEKNPDGTWNTKAQVWEIIRNKDYGRYLPDSIAFPENGDKYILSGFDPEFVLDTMIPKAEQELLEKAQEYVDKSKIDPSTYDCKMMPTYIYNDGKVKLFDIGDRVNLINKAYFDNGRKSRIIGFEYPLDIPYDSPIYTVGETAAYSRIGALEEKVDSLTYQGQTYTGSAGGGGGGSSVYIIGKNDKTSPSDSKVFSSLRTLSEILANNEELKKLFLGKYGPDETEHLLELLGGIFVRGGIDTDSITSELVEAVKVAATDIDAAETVSGKNVLAADTVKGNYIEAKETVKGKNAAISGKTTTLNLLVQQLAEMYDLNVSHVATMFRTIIKDYISSETFIPGFSGEGMKIYKALNGDWNLEIDNVVVRKVMTIFELVISKIRSVNGGLVISPANGRVKSVSLSVGSPIYYVLEIEGDNQFVADDLVRCQVFTSGQTKYYWVAVSSVMPDSILVLKSEFANGVVPAVGDDLVQMGNRTNKARQGLLYLTASEDGKPRFSVMDGVNSTSTVGKSKVILGCLDGMTDTDFPADFQPSGYGLYAGNVFLKGMFLLRNGKSVDSEIDSAKGDAQAAKSNAQAAKNTADTAKSLADAADVLLSDIANDDKLTPSEKQATKQEWDSILAEKLKNDASADKYGVSKVAYNSAYTTLVLYLAPLLTPITTTSNISGSTFRTKFKAYYDARSEMLNAISAKAKDLSDAAQSKADKAETDASNAQKAASDAATAASNAQTTANNALGNANGANALLADIANDNKFTPSEKQSTKKEWDAIVSEKPLNDSSADKFGVVKTTYGTAYTALSTYITPLLTSLTTTQDIVGATFRSAFKTYYDARTNLLNAISAQAKALADAAQLKADAAKKAADDLGTQLTTIETKFEIREGQISAKVTEVTTKATQAATSATNAKTSETNASGSASTAGQKATAAAGSAATAGTKAGEASTSATNAKTSETNAGTKAADAKKSADDAAAKLVTISQKESSINQTAGSISLQVTEVTTKAGQAAASASAAAGSAGTASAKATAASASESAAANSALIARAMSSGKMLYRDPTFKEGGNSIMAYNNSGGSSVSAIRVAAIAGCPTTSGYCLKISNIGGISSPGWGGFTFNTPTRANAIFVIRLMAIIPVGRSINFASNATGTGDERKWLTDSDGTGKWTEYAFKLVCGATGNFATTAYFYLLGGTAPTAADPLVWYLSYATVFDITDAEVDYLADAAGKYTTKTEHSSSITQLSNSIELKVAKTDFNALGNRVSNAETTITQHTGQIALKASQSDVTALGARMSSAEAKITPDAIKLTVKSQTDSISASAASNAINGLQVGGRNYFISSARKITYGGGMSYLANESNCPYGFYAVGDNDSTNWLRISDVIKSNGWWVVSWEMRGSQSCSVNVKVDICDIGDAVFATTNNNTWKRYSLTVNVSNYGDGSVYNFVDFENFSWAFFFIRNIKIEQGNKATDWTPAPEDVTADAQAKANAAQSAAEAVASAKANLAKTEANAHADGIVSAEEQRAINDAKVKLEEAKRDAQSKADAAKNAAISDAAGKYTTKTEHSSSITQLSGKIELKVAKTDFDALGRRVGTAETTITQHTSQISLKASQSDVTALGNRVSTAELKLDPSQIWLGIKGNVSALVPTYSQIVDARSLDSNKYYLVTIKMSTVIPYTITVRRDLNGGFGVPPYSTHGGGFSVLCKWRCNGSGWGCITPKRTVHTFTYSFSTVCPVGNIGQLNESSDEYIYVRGGSKYEVQVDGTSSTTITLRTTTHTPYPDYPNASLPGIIDSVTPPVVDLDTKLTEEQVKAGIGITENGLTVFGQFIDFTGRVTFNSLSGDTQNIINGKATTGYVDSSKSDAITDARNNIALKLGYTNYADMEAKAAAGQTIITGGKIRTSLIDAKAIVTGVLAADAITATNLTVSGNSKIGDFRIDGGSLSAEGKATIIGFQYGSNSASFAAGQISIGKYTPGYALVINGGSGGVSMDVSTFIVDTERGAEFRCGSYNSSKTALKVTGKTVLAYNSGDSTQTALDVTGKIKMNGAFGWNGSYEIDAAWNGGWRKIGLTFTNGILTNVYWP